MVPTIGTRGIFSFGEPYAHLVNEDQEFTVVAVRSLTELQASGEKPFETIYTPVGSTETEFVSDLTNDVPIVTLKMDGGEFFYVPANKLLSDSKQTGIKYVEKSIMVNVGYLPKDTDMTLVTQLISESVYDAIGITPSVTAVDTSGVVHVDNDKHTTLTITRDNISSVDKSYKTKYAELLELYNDQLALLANIEDVYTQ